SGGIVIARMTPIESAEPRVSSPVLGTHLNGALKSLFSFVCFAQTHVGTGQTAKRIIVRRIQLHGALHFLRCVLVVPGTVVNHSQADVTCREIPGKSNRLLAAMQSFIHPFRFSI